MKRRSRYFALIMFALLLLLPLCGCGGRSVEGLTLDYDAMVEATLKSMTLEEKVGQLLCPLGWPVYEKSADGVVSVSEAGRELLDEKQVGMLWATFRADPWTRKTLETGLDPTRSAALSQLLFESDLPVLLAEEAPHGHMAIGATVFPTGIGQAATWDTGLLERMGACIGRELRARGAFIGFGPVIDLARDPRWSRVEETFGEDHFLTGELAAAVVRGASSEGVLSTLKHFAAYGVPSGGHNGNPSLVGERDLRECFLPPFRRAIEAGAGAVMTSYNSIDGVPTTCNESLLTGVLRDEWGFEGLVISDLGSIDGLASTHHVAADKQEAAEMALRAGVDVDLGAGCYPFLVRSVREGRISEKIVDRAVRRLLKCKYEHSTNLAPRPAEVAEGWVHGDKARSVALQAARESVTLLENNGILPLKAGMRIALVGPNADNIYNQLGDYTAPQAEGKVVTMLDGLLSRGASVKYVKGCAVRDESEDSIAEAVKAARASDVVVAVVGGSSARDFRTSYEDTGAALTGDSAVSDMEAGEGFDRSSLDLLGLQPQLLNALKATGKPLVVVYVEGRPLDKRWARENADALLTLWYPGEQGGTALAEVLLGDYNPAGRLPVSVPRDAGQLPVYYNRRIPAGHDYVEESAEPLYPFGYGLSYTSFEYGDLALNSEDGLSEGLMQKSRFLVASGHKGSDFAEGEARPTMTATIDITNVGSRDGDEVVQLYLIDEIASTVRPRKQLCGFARVFIPAGETRSVSIPLDPRSFELVDASGRSVVEPGTFRLQAGASSEDIRSEITLTYEK